mmetsp:Transcript_5008/g.12907  ORF Transcript_5008/g.12907 Transcript_5008/m.12907 type:complete len:295 (-) Transcript_5008:1583-2467(-)
MRSLSSIPLRASSESWPALARTAAIAAVQSSTTRGKSLCLRWHAARFARQLHRNSTPPFEPTAVELGSAASVEDVSSSCHSSSASAASARVYSAIARAASPARKLASASSLSCDGLSSCAAPSGGAPGSASCTAPPSGGGAAAGAAATSPVTSGTPLSASGVSRSWAAIAADGVAAAALRSSPSSMPRARAASVTARSCAAMSLSDGANAVARLRSAWAECQLPSSHLAVALRSSSLRRVRSGQSWLSTAWASATRSAVSHSVTHRACACAASAAAAAFARVGMCMGPSASASE